MPLTATVTPGETFPDNTTITRAKLRNAANPTVQMAGNWADNEVANDAGIALSKLAGIGENNLLVGGSSSNLSGSGKNITAVALPTTGANVNGSVNSTTGITPSDNTISAAKLAKTQSTNVIRGLNDMGYCTINNQVDATKRTKAACESASGVWTQESVAANDHLLICNVSQDNDTEQVGSSADNLRRVSVENLLKSTFTTQVQYDDLTSGGAMTATGTKTVNFDGKPVQVIALSTPAGDATSYTLTVTYNNGALSGFAKHVMLVISNNTPTSTIDLAFTAPGQGKYWFLNSKPPTSIAAGKLGVLAMTSWPGDKCIAGWAVEP